MLTPYRADGDGRAEPDWAVYARREGTIDVWLRAERSGRGAGSEYTIHAAAVEGSRNRLTAEHNVAVTRDQRRRR